MDNKKTCIAISMGICSNTLEFQNSKTARTDWRYINQWYTNKTADPILTPETQQNLKVYLRNDIHSSFYLWKKWYTKLQPVPMVRYSVRVRTNYMYTKFDNTVECFRSIIPVYNN